MLLPDADDLSWIRNDAAALFLRTQMLMKQLVSQMKSDRQNFFPDNRTRAGK